MLLPAFLFSLVPIYIYFSLRQDQELILRMIIGILAEIIVISIIWITYN